MNHISIFYPNYCVLSSKTEKPQKDKIVLYNYTCFAKDYSDILVATRLMILNNYKIINPNLNRLNKRENIEWTFFTTLSVQSLKKIWKDFLLDDKLNYMIDTIKFINDS
jgi:hypothetical protein